MMEWQLRERHETDVKRILREDGCMDQKGQLRSWHGKRTNDALEKAGHDKLDFFNCRCRREGMKGS
jgi:hypothetical protein